MFIENKLIHFLKYNQYVINIVSIVAYCVHTVLETIEKSIALFLEIRDFKSSW